MKSKNAVIEQVNGLRKIIGFGALCLATPVAALPAHASSASKSVSVGNSIFGASARVSFGDDSTGAVYRATVAASAVGKVLKAKLSLAAGSSSLEIKSPSEGRAYGYLKLAGVTRARWNKSFHGDANFSTARFVKKLGGGSTRFYLGPVPVSVKAAVKVSIYAKGNVKVSASPTSGLPQMQSSVGPVMDAAATASAGVDMWLAGADISGSLTLVGLGLRGDINYEAGTTADPTVSHNVTSDVRSTDGAIKLCAWLARKRWCKTIYRFNGWRESYLMSSNSL